MTTRDDSIVAIAEDTYRHVLDNPSDAVFVVACDRETADRFYELAKDLVEASTEPAPFKLLSIEVED